MMIAFAVIPTVAFKWVFQTWTIYVLIFTCPIGSEMTLILKYNEIDEDSKKEQFFLHIIKTIFNNIEKDYSLVIN